MRNPAATLRHWMKVATTVQQSALAWELGTSRNTLYQYSSGTRQPSVLRAAEIERATQKMYVQSDGALPVVLRTTLAVACAQCEYAARCLEKKKKKTKAQPAS